MLDAFKNFAIANIRDGFTYDDVETSITLETGKGARFPAVGASGGYNAVWWNVSDYGDPSEDPNAEVVRVTAIAGDVLTVTRGQEGITATTKNDAGKVYRFCALVTAKTWNTDVAAISAAAAAAQGSADAATALANRVELCIAVSDETTALTTGTAKVTFRVPFDFILSDVRASVNTVSSSGKPTVDINVGGVSIFSTTLTIDVSEKTSTTASIAYAFADPSMPDDEEVTIDIDTAGTGAKGLKIWLYGDRV
jgi:hypothetical protein